MHIKKWRDNMGPETITTNELYFMDADTRSVVKLDGIYGIKTVNEIRSELDLDPVEDVSVMTIPQEYSITFNMGSFHVNDDSVIFDLIHPVKCNCRNCGAPVKLEYCEYCGTPYPTDYKLGMKFGGN